MRDGFVGLDLNGGVDRCCRIEWPTRERIGETCVNRGVVINPADKAAPFLVGHAAKMSPVARGWSRPVRAVNAGERYHVAELMARLREDNAGRGANDTDMLAAHVRHLVGTARQAGIVVSDDFGPGAQTRLLDVSRRANRFDPKRGWTGWVAFPVWRSVATVFSWASRIDKGLLSRLRERRVLVVSLLDDRISVAPLQIDLDQDHGEILATPVRQTKGKSGPADYTPKFAEIELVDRIGDVQVREQVEAVGGERELLRTGAASLVFQRKDGTWFENTHWPKVNDQLREKLQERGSADIRFLQEEVKADDIVLIENPESDRGIRNVIWSAWYAQKIRGFYGISSGDVYELPSEAAALGASEYVARIANGLPTYFDHLYGIEIAALNEDGESHDFIALFPERTRVPGNEPFKAPLKGRFAIQPGSRSLSFHLWRQDDPDHVRWSKTELDTPPTDRVPITLEVTQRPVSGYAMIEVLPEIDGALGTRRIVLDWEKMDVDAKSRAEVIAGLDRNLPKSYPNHLPTITHPVAWEVIDIRRAMRSFLSTPARSPGFDRAVADLLATIRRRVNNPVQVGVPIDHPVYLFDSDGDIPLGILPDRQGDPADLVAKVRMKIAYDIQELHGAQAWRSAAGMPPIMPAVMSNLILTGCWMYAGAPPTCLAYVRDVFHDLAPIGRRVESIGRIVSTDDDVKAALKWLINRLRNKTPKGTAKLQIARELKAISAIIEYRESAYRFLDSKDAFDLVYFALLNLKAQLDAKDARGRPKNLNFSFFVSAKVFLLSLRYRKKDQRFLEPPAKNERADQNYKAALQILEFAFDTVKEDVRRQRRKVHRLAPDVISNAIEFLQKTGGNPDILVVISTAEADADADDDDDDN